MFQRAKSFILGNKKKESAKTKPVELSESSHLRRTINLGKLDQTTPNIYSSLRCNPTRRTDLSTKPEKRRSMTFSLENLAYHIDMQDKRLSGLSGESPEETDFEPYKRSSLQCPPNVPEDNLSRSRSGVLVNPNLEAKLALEASLAAKSKSDRALSHAKEPARRVFESRHPDIFARQRAKTELEIKRVGNTQRVDRFDEEGTFDRKLTKVEMLKQRQLQLGASSPEPVYEALRDDVILRRESGKSRALPQDSQRPPLDRCGESEDCYRSLREHRRDSSSRHSRDQISQHERDPNLEYVRDRSLQYESDPKMGYEADPNLQYEGDPNLQYEVDPSSYEKNSRLRYGRTPNLQHPDNQNPEIERNPCIEGYRKHRGETRGLDNAYSLDANARLPGLPPIYSSPASSSLRRSIPKMGTKILLERSRPRNTAIEALKEESLKRDLLLLKKAEDAKLTYMRALDEKSRLEGNNNSETFVRNEPRGRRSLQEGKRIGKVPVDDRRQFLVKSKSFLWKPTEGLMKYL